MTNRTYEEQDFLKKIEKLKKDRQSRKKSKSNNNTKQKHERKNIPKSIKAQIWQIYNQNSKIGKCYVCDRPITDDNFDVGHNTAVANEGDNSIENLRPICRPCNSSMGTMKIEEFKRKWYGTKTKSKSKEIRAGNAKTLIQNEMPISKRELLNKLSREKLIKIAEKLDVCSEIERFLYEKEGYVDILSRSRKVTVEKIKEILGK